MVRNVVLTVVLCAALSCLGCSDTDETMGLGFIPKIKLSGSDEVSYRLGETATFLVQADDADLNMQTLTYTEYDTTADEEGTILNGPEEVDLPRQTGQVTFYRSVFTITIEGPPGERRMDIQIKDASGNLSNISSCVYTVTE